MTYYAEFSEEFEKELVKLSKKEKGLLDRVQRKIKEIIEDPEHYKPLQYSLKGLRRAHIGHFVIIFEVKENIVRFVTFKHHDFAYSR